MISFFKKICPPFLRPFYSIVKNWRLKLLKWRPTYDDGWLITNKRSEFRKDPRFRNAFDTTIRTGQYKIGSHFEWRTYVACWAAEHGARLEGDFVECGVEYGHLSRAIMEYLDFNNLNKKFYLIDTYNGVDKRYLTENDLTREIYYPEMYEWTKKAFASFPNSILIRGAIPDVLASLDYIKKVAYLSIDMNTVIPEIAAAEYFWPKMSTGAIIIHDDYGHPGFDEQRIGLDKWAKEKRVSVLCLPTGQGLIIKP